MTNLGSPFLDPKLRRTLSSRDDLARLSRDRARAVASEDSPAAALAAEPVSAATFTQRVLVRLTSPEVPAELADLSWVPVVEGIWAVEVPLTRLEELAAAGNVEYVEAGRALGPSLSTSLAETRADRLRNPPPPAVGLDGTGVVVGIVDFGLDFTLDDFRNADGSTRVAFLWDQFLSPQAGESSPQPFGYGVEYTRADIDAALGSADPFAGVRHRPDVSSHGTHVAGIAVGSGRAADAAFPAATFVGAAPGATIVFVQPSSADAQTTFTDSVHVAEAIAYVFARAAELGMPCVVNMSLGQNGGSHDGESLLERAIDRLLEQPGRAMTVAAGNEHVWRGHASGSVPAGGTRVLRWQFGGGLPVGGGALPAGIDFTPNEMEVWYDSRDRLRARVTSPGGESSPWVEPGETVVHDFAGGERAFIDSERFTVLNGDARVYVELSPPGLSGLPNGLWKVELEGDRIVDGRFDAWIERDVRRPSNAFADQSFFVGADFDGVRTLGTPATNRRAVAVANYDHVALAPQESSGRGRTRDGRAKPEVAAPGTNILSCNALGGRPLPTGGVAPVRVAKTGTSMSAPHVAGIIALLLEKNPELSATQTAKVLIAGCRPPEGVTPFDDAWGFGQVDAEAAAALV
ncbi:MAG TPA: S8 family peptidase [Thermoanaerobaculia bacterium]